MKPFFSEKNSAKNKITLIEDETIISDDITVAKTMNNYFTNAVKDLQIKGFETENISDENIDNINRTILQFGKHPSIIKIKENVKIGEKFSFSKTTLQNIEEKITNLNINKATTLDNIPAKILVQFKERCSKFIYKYYNDSVTEGLFPDSMKMADVTPAHKKDDKTDKKI